MKKNIIMVTIILICSLSLLLVLYYFRTKDIYYISDKIIDNNEITMQIKNESTYTNLETLNDLDSSKYYRISNETNCSSGTASFYYSNSTNKLKLKVTSNPLKCKIVFEEIKGDINVVAIYVDNLLVTSLDNTKNYDLDTYSCENLDGTTSNVVVTWNNKTKAIALSPITKEVTCKLYLKQYYNLEIVATNVDTLEHSEYTLTNVLENPDFIDGLTGWSPYNNNATVTNGVLTYTPSVAWSGALANNGIFIHGKSDVIYRRAYGYSTSTDSSFRFCLATTAVYTCPIIYRMSSNGISSSLWQSSLTTAVSSTFVILNATAFGTLYVDNLILSNITETFGQGNEPTEAKLNSYPFYEKNLKIANIKIYKEKQTSGSNITSGSIIPLTGYSTTNFNCTGNQIYFNISNNTYTSSVAQNVTSDVICTIYNTR